MLLHTYSVYRKELETYMYQGSRLADMRSQLLRNSLKRSRSFWKQASDRGKICSTCGTVKNIIKKNNILSNANSSFVISCRNQIIELPTILITTWYWNLFLCGQFIPQRELLDKLLARDYGFSVRTA